MGLLSDGSDASATYYLLNASNSSASSNIVTPGTIAWGTTRVCEVVSYAIGTGNTYANVAPDGRILFFTWGYATRNTYFSYGAGTAGTKMDYVVAIPYASPVAASLDSGWWILVKVYNID
jgi:hypothetical protein